MSLRIVLLFACEEPRILQHRDIARLHRFATASVGTVPIDEPDLAPEQLRCRVRTTIASDRLGVAAAPLGRPKCASTSTIAPLSASSVTVGIVARKPRIVGHRAIGHRHVQILADQHALAV